jgi:glycosyltransferase involved in cell wall biosynthesis
MKIAQVAPLYEAVPPKLYGGTERIVSYLTEELVAQGHDVTLFASGDSQTAASLVAVVPDALRLVEDCVDSLAPHIVMLEKVMEQAHKFDIIHFHTDYLSFPFASRLKTPHLTTLHGKLTLMELHAIYNQYRDEPVISISHDQRKPLPQANFIRNVYHGLPEAFLKLGSGKGGYFAFLGRISPEKRCDRAIEMAIKSSTTLIIAAKVDKVDQEYFDAEIKPLLDHPLINFIGEIGDDEKQEFLGNARALLFPIDWSEPFGLVMIEAMACGTPVIAWNMGSVSEIIEDGKTGFIVTDINEAMEAANKISMMNRQSVRDIFEQRFTARRMATDYLQIYETLISKDFRLTQTKNRMLSADYTDKSQSSTVI